VIRLVTLCALLALSACAIVPNSIRPEFEHMSHLSQHLSAAHTNYGANIVNVVAHWDTPAHTYIELAEGIDLDRHYRDINSYGDIIGSREEFTARIGYVFQVKP